MNSTINQLDDVLILGAGAAGMMCAAQAGQAKLRVRLIDHATKIGEKIRISGGGRCNFTNTHLNGHDASRYFVSAHPRFVRHALSRYHAQHITALLDAYQIAWHEKHRGQLFCSHSATDIITMLQHECQQGQVQWQTGTTIEHITYEHGVYVVNTNHGSFRARALVVATGALAAPAIGATGLGYEIAKQFGHRIITPNAALVPLRFEHWSNHGFDTLAGMALPVRIHTGQGKHAIAFEEDLLFRHKGLSGPAILQISSYWQPGQTLSIDLCPHIDLAHALCHGKHGQKRLLATALADVATSLPKRLVAFWLQQPQWSALAKHKWADIADQHLIALGQSLNQWHVLPSGHDGHKKAEATRGGVDVADIDPKTMHSRLQPDLYFIGEVMDITGWLGGYNFQWAWSSAVCAAHALALALKHPHHNQTNIS